MTTITINNKSFDLNTRVKTLETDYDQPGNQQVLIQRRMTLGEFLGRELNCEGIQAVTMDGDHGFYRYFEDGFKLHTCAFPRWKFYRFDSRRWATMNSAGSYEDCPGNFLVPRNDRPRKSGCLTR